MKTFNEILNEITEKLTPDQLQLLKDTINYGGWGDCDMEFLNPDGTLSLHVCFGYCTNDAKDAGHFSGRKVSAMFRSMYHRLGMNNDYGSNEYFVHCSDWWGDGTGDMFFIASFRPEGGEAIYEKFEEWARA